jgi:UDP-glucuronate 4-epimerase
VRQILEERAHRVIAVDRQAGSDTFGRVIECDLGDVHRVHARDGICGVIHCGAHSGPMAARDNPYSMVQVNIVGTANVLEVARVHKTTRFVYCSSTSAYGPTPPGPVPEDVTMRPSTVYGASKVASEQLISTYPSQYGLNGTSPRLSWVYGPRRTTDCVIRTMIADSAHTCGFWPRSMWRMRLARWP